MVVVEGDPEVPEVRPVLLADPLDERFGRDPFLLRLEHDRRAVPVVGADVHAAVAAPALEPHPDVGLDVLDHVPDVNRAVRVRQRARHEERAGRIGHEFESVAPAEVRNRVR